LNEGNGVRFTAIIPAVLSKSTLPDVLPWEGSGCAGGKRLDNIDELRLESWDGCAAFNEWQNMGKFGVHHGVVVVEMEALGAGNVQGGKGDGNNFPASSEGEWREITRVPVHMGSMIVTATKMNCEGTDRSYVRGLL